LNKNKVQARFSLQAVQAGNRLVVSLFDNIQQQTRLNVEIDLKATSLDSAARSIASRVVQEFNQPLLVARDVVPNTVYLRYLQVSSTLRQPLTEPALNKAIDELNVIITEAPRFTEAQASLCQAYIESYRLTGEPQEYQKAEKHCFRATRLADNNPLVNIALGQLYKTGGQLDEATNSYEQALATSPFLTDAISGLASVKLAQGKIDEAVALYKRAQHYEPSSWKYYSQLAELYFRSGDFESAIEYDLIAKRLVTDESLVLGNLGSSYFMMEDFENAIIIWEESLGLQVTFYTLSNLGSAYYFRGDFRAALNSYEKAIEINERDYRLWLNAGEAAFHSEEKSGPFYNKSITLAEAQLAINPDEAEILSALALCYASLGQFDIARDHIKRLLSDENDIFVLYDVAAAYSRLGEVELMKQTLEKMISNGYSTTLIERDANFIEK
jgi:tetratricopeptide (TPR) repeat protein